MQNDVNKQEFDESTYLKFNPDVQSAVARGQFASGLDHFLTFGQFENRRGVPDSETLSDSSPIYPPEHLRFRVHGGRDLPGYLRVGQIVANDLEKLVSSKLVVVPDNGIILDFGSGPGRVVTWFQPKHSEWKFFGTDIDEEAIAWARDHLKHIASFDCNPAMPPLRYADGNFDFVYSISIFTHLPEEMQESWLCELARVTRSGGYLALTTHAEHLLPAKVKFPESGFYYSVGPGTDGLPGFYQTSFQTADYVRRNWSKYFVIEKVIPGGLANHQDLIVCRKP